MKYFLIKHTLSAFCWIAILSISQTISSLLSGEWVDRQYYVYTSLIGGVIISLFFAVIHYLRLKRAGIAVLEKNTVRVKQVRIINTLLSRQEVLQRTQRYFRKKATQLPNGHIEFRITSLFGWYRVTVQFLTNKEEVKIECSPLLGTTLLDHGESLYKINELEKQITIN